MTDSYQRTGVCASRALGAPLAQKNVVPPRRMLNAELAVAVGAERYTRLKGLAFRRRVA